MMQNRVVGIIGGIGSGKSVVMDILEKEYKAKIILADAVGHELMQPGGANYQGIIDRFGKEILAEDGQIDRRKLGALAFRCDANLEALNRITHSNIIREIQKRISDAFCDPKVSIVCLETALPKKSLLALCKEIWYIYVPEEIRIQRLIEGRGYTKDYCQQIIRKQEEEETFRKLSDKIIDNGGSVEDTRKQIAEFLS